MTRFRPLAALAAGLLIACVGVRAQGRLELSVGYGLNKPAWDVTYVHQYTPRFLYDPTAQTSGSQTLTFKANQKGGVGYGAAFFFGQHFAIQALVSSLDTDLTGTTSAHQTSVTYTSIMPPFTTPSRTTLSFSDEPSTPGGQMSNRAISLNGLFRLTLPYGFSVDLSAGATWFHAEADLAPVEYSKFWLGGHSVLFGETYALQMILDPVDAIGGNAGASLSWKLGINAAVWVDARYYFCRKVVPPVRFQNTGTLAAINAFDPAADIVAVDNLTIDPSFFRIGGGFRFIF